MTPPLALPHRATLLPMTLNLPSQPQTVVGLSGSCPIADLLAAYVAASPGFDKQIDKQSWRLLRELNELADPRLAIPSPGERAWSKARVLLQQAGPERQLRHAIDVASGRGPRPANRAPCLAAQSCRGAGTAPWCCA